MSAGTDTTAAIRMHAPGGPDVLRFESVSLPPPGPGEIRVQHTAIGLNYLDTYVRSGLYPIDLPAIIGNEAAGVVETVGEGVADFGPGDRVGYVDPIGAYTGRRNLPATRAIPLPEGIDDRAAAAVLLKGLTAQYLLRRTHRVAPRQRVLVHAAAGGVGTILVRWAKALGATVIGTVGTDAKAEAARQNGCDHPIVYTRERFLDRVLDLTDGEGVHVVYDGVGAATFEDSLACLRPLGTMVSFGNASGAVSPIAPLRLAEKSLFLTRPSLKTYAAKREDLLAGAAELFDAIDAGAVRAVIGRTFPLAEAPAAHRALEARETTGSTLLLP